MALANISHVHGNHFSCVFQFYELKAFYVYFISLDEPDLSVNFPMNVPHLDDLEMTCTWQDSLQIQKLIWYKSGANSGSGNIGILELHFEDGVPKYNEPNAQYQGRIEKVFHNPSLTQHKILLTNVSSGDDGEYFCEITIPKANDVISYNSPLKSLSIQGMIF